MNTQEAFSISISGIYWGLSSTSYSTDDPHAVFDYSFRNDGDARNRFYVTGIVEDPNGFATQMTPRIIKLNPGESKIDKLTWNPASRTFPEGQYSAQIKIWQSEHDYEENKNPLFTVPIDNAFVLKKPLPPTPILSYRSTFLSLQVQDGTSQEYIKVKPALTYGSGSKLDADVSIYVDGTYKTKVASNQWSSNIYTGSGSHTIRALIGEMPNIFDNSIRYRASSDTVNYFVKAASIVGSGSSGVSSGSGGMGSGVTSSENFPIVYVVIAVAVAAAAGIGIGLSKRKKTAPVISVSPAKAQTPQTQDDTQFWVCPPCGGDTQYKNGKQFCPSCNMYL